MVSHSLKSAAAELKLRRSKTLPSIVRDAIEEMILSGELRSGDRVNESTLAQQLGVSRGPIREACRGLEQAGYLETVVNQGMYVREIGLVEARQLYEIRAALCGLAGRLVCERITADQLGELDQLVARMQAQADLDDFNAYYPLNLAFHRKLMEFSGNRKLQGLYDNIINQLHLYRRRGLLQKGNLATSNAEHAGIVAAIKSGDPERAARAMERHVRIAYERMRAAPAQSEAGANDINIKEENKS